MKGGSSSATAEEDAIYQKIKTYFEKLTFSDVSS
jgi:hypothetical protein